MQFLGVFVMEYLQVCVMYSCCAEHPLELLVHTGVCELPKLHCYLSMCMLLKIHVKLSVTQ